MSSPEHPKKDPKAALNNYAKYSGMAFQMAITIGLGIWLGMYLDKKFNTSMPIMTALCAVVFMGFSLYSIIKKA